MSYTEISVLRERHGQGIALPRRKGCESSRIPQMQYSTASAQDQAGLSLSGPANMLTTCMYVDQAMEHTNPKKLQPLTIHGEKFFLKPFTPWPEPTLMTAPGWDQGSTDHCTDATWTKLEGPQVYLISFANYIHLRPAAYWTNPTTTNRAVSRSHCPNQQRIHTGQSAQTRIMATWQALLTTFWQWWLNL